MKRLSSKLLESDTCENKIKKVSNNIEVDGTRKEDSENSKKDLNVSNEYELNNASNQNTSEEENDLEESSENTSVNDPDTSE